MKDRVDEPEIAEPGMGKDHQLSCARPKIRQAKQLQVERWDAPLPFAIAFAAFIYPSVAAPLFAVVVAATSNSLPDLSEFLAGCLFALFIVVASGCLLAFVSLPFSTLAWGLVWLVRRSLGLGLDKWRVGAHVGAWTSLVMFLVSLIILEDDLIGLGRLGTGELFLLFLLGPGIATPLAQYAGAWSQWPRRQKNEPPTKRQFGISQVLVLTAWVALSLTLLKLVDVLHPVSMMYLCGWIAYQWFTMGLVLRVCEWRSRRVVGR